MKVCQSVELMFDCSQRYLFNFNTIRLSQISFAAQTQQIMNLKERMQRQNKNNSQILNNSGFDFNKGNREDQMYEKSRRQCEEELYNRKADLEHERNSMFKTKEKQANFAIEKFTQDFEQFRKQILSHVDSSLSQTKSRFLSEIKQRLSVDTNEEIRIRKEIDELMNFINTHIAGLKKDHYREYISKIVVTDFDGPRDEVKRSVKNIKYAMPYTTIDEKYYSCFRNDLQKCIYVQFGAKFEGKRSEAKLAQQPPTYPKSESGSDLNLHENRDRLKMGFS